MADFEQHKIQIFTGVNDIPEPPTESEGSNISHMHEQFNNLIDSVVTGHNELINDIQTKYDSNKAYIETTYTYAFSAYEASTQNSTTITNNRIYHDGVTTGLSNDITALLQRITALETEVFGDTSLYVFDNFTMVNGEFIFTIPATGNLVEILVNDVTNQFNLYFYSSEFNFTQQFNISTVEGYGYDYSPDTPVAVQAGYPLTMNNSGQNDSLITKVRLKIV